MTKQKPIRKPGEHSRIRDSFGPALVIVLGLVLIMALYVWLRP